MSEKVEMTVRSLLGEVSCVLGISASFCEYSEVVVIWLVSSRRGMEGKC